MPGTPGCVEGSPWIKHSVDAWNYFVYPGDEGRAAQILSSHNTFTATFLLAGVVQNTSTRDAKKSQWRRARSEGHTVTWRIFFFSSDSKKRCQSGSSLALPPEGSSRSFKLELFVYCSGEDDAKRLSVYRVHWVHCEIISLGVTQGKLILCHSDWAWFALRHVPHPTGKKEIHSALSFVVYGIILQAYV